MENIEMQSIDPNPNPNTQPPARKFSVNALISYIDRSLLQSIESIYRLKNDGLDILQFSRFFLNCIEHQQHETIFLAASLSQLFQLISQGNNKIKFSQITDFICERILEEESEQNEVLAHWVPIKGHDKQNLTYLKNPPVVKGGSTEEVCKVWMGESLHDKGKHDNIINQAYFSQSKSKIYCLQSLADWIGVYTPQAKLESKIRPSSFKVKKDSAVLSIAFSEGEQRLGAILKDFSISFWDAWDNFGFQKSIPTAKYCQQLQSSIWYLQYFQKWVSGDMAGVIYIWNLAEERPQKTLRCKGRARINDLCEIPSIGALAVVQEQRGAHNQSTKIQLLSVTKGDTLAEIDTRNDRRMLHSLKYSEEYQLLLAAGFQKRISLFQINTVYLDTSLKGELLGHESAITCFTLIRKTPMVVSADDKGKVKVWNIRNSKCMQTIDFTDKVIITKLLDLYSQNKIAVLGSRITLLYFDRPPQSITDVAPLKVKQLRDCLHIITSKDLRQLDLKEGRLQKIDCHFHNQPYETTSVFISSKGETITGNQKGQINVYNNRTGKWLQSVSCHLGAVNYIEEDTANNFLISASDHNGFVISKYRIECLEQIRSIRGNFIGKEICSVVFSSYHSIIAFISNASVFILDYKELKLLFELYFEEEYPLSLSLINGLALLLVGTSKGTIHIVQLDNNRVKPFLNVRGSAKGINHIIADLKCREIDQAIFVQSNCIYFSDQAGIIRSLDITQETKRVSFKSCQITSASYNPYRQIRQNFEVQLKKGKFTQVQMKEMSQIGFKGSIVNLGEHSGGVTSLGMVQFDEHVLVSTGLDNRVKVWLDEELVCDININRPLPYAWNLNCSQNKKFTKNILQGIELIQAIFKRFGKDISIGESQIFKLTNGQTNRCQTTANFKRKKPTLLQEQFNVVDLNYEKIKRQKLLPINGPTLKRMEITKNIENLQKEWQSAKEKEQEEREKLMKSIQTKAYKNQERDTVAGMLKDKNANQSSLSTQPSLIQLQQKLDNSIQPVFYISDALIRSTPMRQTKDQHTFRYSSKKVKAGKGFDPTKTFQNYFTQKFQGHTQSINVSPQKVCRDSSQKKQNNFRLMLKQMRQKLSKSKKQFQADSTFSQIRPQTQLHSRHQSAILLRENQHY